MEKTSRYERFHQLWKFYWQNTYLWRGLSESKKGPWGTSDEVLPNSMSMAEPVWRRQSVGIGIEQSRVRNSIVPTGFSPQARKLIDNVRWRSSLVVLIGLSPHHCSCVGRAPLHSSVKTKHSENTLCLQKCRKPVQAVVGSIVWVFPRPKKPTSRKMSASGYAFQSVCPQLFFFIFWSHPSIAWSNFLLAPITLLPLSLHRVCGYTLNAVKACKNWRICENPSVE